MSNLSSEERALLAAFENGELQPVESQSKNEMVEAAREHSMGCSTSLE